MSTASRECVVQVHRIFFESFETMHQKKYRHIESIMVPLWNHALNVGCYDIMEVEQDLRKKLLFNDNNGQGNARAASQFYKVCHICSVHFLFSTFFFFMSQCFWWKNAVALVNFVLIRC